MKRVVLLITVMMLGMLVSSGVALAVAERGTDGDNTIKGTKDTESLSGRGGNDTISGLNGSDSISGGPGNDKLWGGEPPPFVSKSGNNSIRGGNGNDLVVGGFGSDTLHGGAGNDTVVEGPDEDQSRDVMSGGAGDDLMSAAGVPASKDVISCGPGNDTVQADKVDDVAKDCEDVEIFDPETPVDGASSDFRAASRSYFDCTTKRFGWKYCPPSFTLRAGEGAGVDLVASGGNKRIDFRLYLDFWGPNQRVGNIIRLYPGQTKFVNYRWGGRYGQAAFFQVASPAVVRVQTQGFYRTI